MLDTADRIVTTEKRYEIKLVASVDQYDGLMAYMRLHNLGFSVPYPPRRINNIYFDTLDLSAYYANLSGDCARRKLRYRWYGKDPAPQAGILEIKAKHHPLGWKHVCPVSSAFYDDGMTWGQLTRRLRRHLPPEASNWVAGSPQVVLINRYERDYFVSRCGRLRVTFDRQLRVLDQRFSPRPNLSRETQLPPVLVVELKCGPGEEPLMQRFLAQFPVRIGRFSKYTLGVGTLLS